MHGWIELVLGRLLNDDQFRAGFLRDPHRAIEDLLARETELTQAETAVTDRAAVWKQIRARHRLTAADLQPKNPLAE